MVPTVNILDFCLQSSAHTTIDFTWPTSVLLLPAHFFLSWTKNHFLCAKIRPHVKYMCQSKNTINITFSKWSAGNFSVTNSLKKSNYFSNKRIIWLKGRCSKNIQIYQALFKPPNTSKSFVKVFQLQKQQCICQYFQMSFILVFWR